MLKKKDVFGTKKVLDNRVIRTEKVLRNKSTNKAISKQVIHARSTFRQGIGLMFHSKRDLIMHFNNPRIISLHNFFVFFPLEIIILNENKQVIEIKQQFNPFTFYTSKNKGSYCIELGTNAAKNHCKVGDILEF